MCAKQQSLLREFVEDRSESAFAELVRAHIDLVHSAARRIVAGDTHLAEDVTQTVFADLARKAHRLPDEMPLSAWLYRHTFFVASSMIRSEQRRRQREQDALAMNAHEEPDLIDWSLLAPHLDRSMNELSEADRQALLLRFFEKQDLRTVGEQLGVGEDAAQKRVSRAIEKLRLKFSKHGIRLSVAGIGTALLTSAVTAAPTALAGKTAAAVLAGTVSGTGTFLVIEQLLSMNTLKPIAGVLLAAGIAVPMFLQHQSLGALRNENAVLAEQASQLGTVRAENERPAVRVVDQQELEALRKEHSDLMRLRGEWTLMRDEIANLKREVARQRALLVAKGASEEELLSSEEREARRQVLIESHIVEVPLNSRIWQEFGLRPPTSGEDGGLFTAMQDVVASRLIERVKETEGVDILAGPRVTTLNGRQSQISATSLKTVITGVSNNVVTTEQLAVGPVIDFLPKFEKDGEKIALDVKLHMKQLIEPDATQVAMPGQLEHQSGLPPEFQSLPLVQDRNLEATLNLNPGQVLVLTGGYSAGRQMMTPAGQGSGGPTGLLVIVSPNEIDRAGNLVVPADVRNEVPVSRTVMQKADGNLE